MCHMGGGGGDFMRDLQLNPGTHTLNLSPPYIFRHTEEVQKHSCLPAINGLSVWVFYHKMGF